LITALANNENYIASGDIMGKVNIFDIYRTGSLMTIIENEAISSLAFSSDRRYIIIATNNNMISMWSLENGLKVKEFNGCDVQHFVTNVMVSSCVYYEKIEIEEKNQI